MMYILTSVMIFLGIAFFAMGEVKKLRAKYPDFPPKKIGVTFLSEEWNTLIVSVLCWLVYELAIFVAYYNGFPIPEWLEMWGVYAIAIVWGYGGSRLIYKYLGTAEKVIADRAKIISDNKD